MPLPYTGNPTGIQAPSPQPAVGAIPIINIPIAGDRGADLWAQGFKMLADWIAFISGRLGIPPTGTLLRRSVFTTTGTLAPIANCTRARFRMVGCGGGSAGARGTTNPENYSGGGGCSGSWGEFETTVIPANWSYTISATGGAGGIAPGTTSTLTAGSAGNSTIFSDGTNTFTCPGGGGADNSFAGGAGGGLPTASPGGTIIFRSDGQRGGSGQRSGSAPVSPIISGYGGSCPYGGGGRSISADAGLSAGQAGTGYGSGGGGAIAAGTGLAGAAGAGGLIILEEWA